MLITVPGYGPVLEQIRLVDYKVRILDYGDGGTGAVTRVMIESADEQGDTWNTVGVSANIIEASYKALRDSMNYKLFKSAITSKHRSDL